MLRGAAGGGGSGTPGSQIRNGSGVPSNAVGIDNDYWIDTDTGFLYQRSAGAYTVVTTLKGSPGDDGSSIQNVIIGNGAPDSTIGQAGNAYIDAASNLIYAPKATASVSPQAFWGVNCHIGYPTSYWPNMTPASYLALFNANGIQAMRTNCSSASKATTYLSQYKALVAGGCDVMICIDAGPNYGGTFASNQTTGTTLGAAIANVLKGSGIVRIECTNECDGPFPAGAGTKITGTNPRGFVADGASYDDFDPARFECWRGMLSGMLAGIRSVTNEFKLGYASGNAFPQTAFRMMREGRDTTGAITKTPLQLDTANPHFYDTESGNLLSFTAKSRIGTNQAVNSLAELRGLTGNATYDVPQTPPFEVYITEWGSRASDVNQGNFINSQSMVLYNNRVALGINAIYVYGLFADSDDSGTGPVFGVAANNFGMIQADGTTKKPSWNYYTANAKANTAVVAGGWPTVPRFLAPPPIGRGDQVLNTLTTTNNTLRTLTVPGRSMGPNTELRITAAFSMPNNANTKTFRITFGGTAYFTASFTTASTVFLELSIQNRNSLASQVGQVLSSIGPAFNAGTIVTSAVDTTVDQTITFAAQAGVGTDQLALERCMVQYVG
jgi:hypothetical protein